MSPISCIFSFGVVYWCHFGILTQLVECLLDVEKVSGSSPLYPTKKDLRRTVLGFLFIQSESDSEGLVCNHAYGVHVIARFRLAYVIAP